MATTFQGIPTPGLAFVDETGRIAPAWYQFLATLYLRTGGGTNVGNVQSLNFITENGITESSTNTNGVVETTLGLGNITPASVTAAGAVGGTNANFSGNLSGSTAQFGIFVGQNGITQSGYIAIQDAAGTPRRLLVG